MAECFLIVNCGSSGIKAAAFAMGSLSGLGRWNADFLADRPEWKGTGPAGEMSEPVPGAAMEALCRLLSSAGLSPVRMGHRVVHGGKDFVRPTEATDAALTRLEAISSMAPLHNPQALATLRAARRHFPAARHFALFDTAFHATIPPVNYRLAVPREWEEKGGIRRFGFHGFSHAWSASKAREILGQDGARRLVVLHLGQGCSATAVLGGRSHATSMGFTPLDGLPMGTRSGAIDPGILLHMLMHGELAVADLNRALWRESGWLALSGVSADFRIVVEAAERGDPHAAFAIGHLVARCREVVASMAAAMGGIDALVFTGGIGENCVPVRDRVVEGLGFLGLPAGSILVIPAEEERQMAGELAAET